jgi:hypothetical protein
VAASRQLESWTVRYVASGDDQQGGDRHTE